MDTKHIDTAIAARREDQAFMARIKAMVQKHQDLLALLARR